MRRGDLVRAHSVLSNLPSESVSTIASRAINELSWAQWSARAGTGDAGQRAGLALEAAQVQGAHAIVRVAELLVALGGGSDIAPSIRVLANVAPWHLTDVVDLVLPHVDELDDGAGGDLLKAANLHPGRWRVALRSYLNADNRSLTAANLLEAIGQNQDVILLRRLARRLAPKAAAADTWAWTLATPSGSGVCGGSGPRDGHGRRPSRSWHPDKTQGPSAPVLPHHSAGVGGHPRPGS